MPTCAVCIRSIRSSSGCVRPCSRRAEIRSQVNPAHVRIPSGPQLKAGQDHADVALLRQRLSIACAGRRQRRCLRRRVGGCGQGLPAAGRPEADRHSQHADPQRAQRCAAAVRRRVRLEAARQHGALALDARESRVVLRLGQRARADDQDLQAGQAGAGRADRGRQAGYADADVLRQHAVRDLPSLVGRAARHEGERAAAAAAARPAAAFSAFSAAPPRCWRRMACA